MRKLTPRETKFVACYLVSLNGADAAREAGYSAKGAKQRADELLRLPAIKAALAEKQAVALTKVDLTAENIKEEIRRLSEFDPRGLFDANGELLHIKDMPREVRAAIKSVEVLKRNTVAGDGVQDMVTKVTWYDKPAALTLAAKHLKLLNETVDINVRYPHAELTDEELNRKILDAAKTVQGVVVE